MAQCPLNSSLVPSLCFPLPLGGEETTSQKKKRKKPKKRERDACALTDLFGLHFLDALMRASRRLPAFLHCRSTYYVVCRCPCGSLQKKKGKKKDHIRVLQLLRRLNVGNGRTRCYFLVELYLLFVMD